MASTREHKVEMALVGSPRWWTITNNDGTLEVVRVVFRNGVHYHDAELSQELVVFALLKPGHYAFPPLVCGALKMGTVGWASVKEGGGRIATYEEPLGKKLEFMLVIPMTPAEACKLGHRAIEAGFKMVPRCLDGDTGGTVVEVSEHGCIKAVMGDWLSEWFEVDTAWPDFRDPTGATQDVLLRQVRERWGRPALYAHPARLPGADWMRWVVKDAPGFICCGSGTIQGNTEIETLIAALEAAPGGKGETSG